jgi:uncharacterized membrane protein
MLWCYGSPNTKSGRIQGRHWRLFGSGTFHLIAPAQFMPLLPDWTPCPLALVYLSGIAELLAAIGLIAKLRWAPIFTSLVLLAVWPANWWVAIEATNNAEIATAVVAWLRLPLQLPLIYWALKSPVRSGE